MARFSLKTLWDLRVELDNAVERQEYERISEVKNKYLEMVDLNANNYDGTFICYRYSFPSYGRADHQRQNVISILNNIEAYERRFLNQEEGVNIKLQTKQEAGYLARDIWILAAIYGKFKQESVVPSEQNKKMGNYVINLLQRIEQNLYNEQRSQVGAIKAGVKGEFEKVYGKNDPRSEFMVLAEDFLEQ